MTLIVDFFLTELIFRELEGQPCCLQRCEHYLERHEVSFERVIDTHQIIHVRKNTRLRTKVTESQRHYLLKKPRRIRHSKRYLFKHYSPVGVTNAVRSTCPSATGSCQNALRMSATEINRAWPRASRQYSRLGIGQVLWMMWWLRVWR